MKYLVTGGAGFIGSHLCERLLAEGNEVVALDDLSTGKLENFRDFNVDTKFEFKQGSVLDSVLVEDLVKTTDGVFHLAAAVGVKKILTEPIKSLHTNIHGTENVLLAATKHRKRVLLASSSEIYGKNDSESLTEESDRVLGSPLLYRWTYSESKALDEALARVLFEREGLQVHIARFFNTVGPRQSPAYGMVIPSFFNAAIEKKPLQIYGDGSQSRVFCHVNDAVNAILLLWNQTSGFGEAYNIGGMEEVSILSLANKILEITGSNSSIEFIPYEELSKLGYEDMKRRVPNTAKLRKFTEWKPEMSLDQIIGSVHESFLHSLR